MDCAAVYENEKISVKEFGTLKKSELIAVGRTENCEEAIFVYPNGLTP